MKRLLLSLSPGCLLLITFLSCNDRTGTLRTYDLKEDESAYVILQLKEENVDPGSTAMTTMFQELVDDIKSFNTKMGFTDLEKKMASTVLPQGDKHVPFMTIRPFENLSAARNYADQLDKELKEVEYGAIPEPFAISQSNYKQCIKESNFSAYYKSYKQSLQQ